MKERTVYVYNQYSVKNKHLNILLAKKNTGLGVALLSQNVLILLANLTYKFGRDEEVWAE